MVRSLHANEIELIPVGFFKGGLGEAPRPKGPEESAIPPSSSLHAAGSSSAAPPLLGPGGHLYGHLDREHRYWLVTKYVQSSNRCTLVPLLANGRFGGCGRRAGRIRWRAAPLREGYERDAPASTLELVPVELVQGAREAEEGDAWCVDDTDVEQAAREQAAAARNKRRRLDEDDGVYQDAAAALGLTRSGLTPRGSGSPARRRETSPRPPRDPSAGPPRKKKRLAPASSTCLACTKGKHCAHTCGVRGKEADDRRAAEKKSTNGAAAKK